MATTSTQTDSAESSTAERAKEEAGRVAEAAKDEVGQLVDSAKDQGRALLSEATDKLRDEVQHQGHRAAENLRSFSSELRTMAQSTEGSGTAGTWVRMGADRFERFADRIEDEGFDGIASDVGNFARRSPMTFLALTFGAGLIAGRVIKNMDTSHLSNSTPTVSQPRFEAASKMTAPQESIGMSG
jgi:hypothetical protein